MQLSQEKCCELIDFAAAELRDVNDGRSEMTCPVLNSLAVADRCKADSRMLWTIFCIYDYLQRGLAIYGKKIKIMLCVYTSNN